MPTARDTRERPHVARPGERPAGVESRWLISPLRPEAVTDPEIRTQWEALLEDRPNLYLQYQSPQWFEHLQSTRDPGLLPPVAVRDARGRLAGIVPITVVERELAFTTKERILWLSRLTVVAVLGSDPLLPRDPGLSERVFEAIAAAAPGVDGIYLHSLPTGSSLWEWLREAQARRDRFLVYVPEEHRRLHFLELPGSFSEYLAKFGAKKRYNLARQVRLLSEHAGGRLELRRVEDPADVRGFAADAATVVERSWQADLLASGVTRAASDPASLEDLARRGLLRSYLLAAGDVPCAFVVGYQYGDVYHYAEIGYDRSFSRFSPGAALLYMLIADLLEHRPPRRVNFGIGDAGYKREFGNRDTTDASVFLLRPTALNKARVRAHATFRAGVGLAKRLAAVRARLAGERATRD